MPFQPVPRTLYATGHRHRSDPRWMICFPDGRCRDLYDGAAAPMSGGWVWQPGWPGREEIARDLTDEEIASLSSPDGREEAVARILEARKLAPSAAPTPPEVLESMWVLPPRYQVRQTWIQHGTSEEGPEGDPEEVWEWRGEGECGDAATAPEAVAAAWESWAEGRQSTLREALDEAEEEVDRWKQGARRLETEAAEAGALVLSHEGRIERLQRDLEAAQADAARLRSELSRADTSTGALRAMAWECLEKMGCLSGNALDLSAAVSALLEGRDRYRAIVREALEVAHAGEAADERLPEIVRDMDGSVGALLGERDRLRLVIVGLAAKIAGVDG